MGAEARSVMAPPNEAPPELAQLLAGL